MSLDFWAAVAPDLESPLNRAHVKQREQSGRKLSYVEGWHAIAEANRIFGFGTWSRETIEIKRVAEYERKIGRAPNQKDGWGVSYTAKVRVVVMGVIREGVGAGHGIDVDLGLAHESAIKEAETDAMKRALMTFGNPFGLALYDKEQAQVVNLPKPISQVADTFIGALQMSKTLDDLTVWLGKVKPSLEKLAEPDKDAIREAYSAHRIRLAEAEYKDAAE
jgi:DNA recombination protein Rad52